MTTPRAIRLHEENGPKYRIQRLEHEGTHGYWRTVSESYDRDKMRQSIYQLRRDIIERNGNSVDGPHFILTKDVIEDGLIHSLIID